MKKINVLGVLLITAFILLTCACGTSKKTTTKPKPIETTTVPDLKVWNNKYQDTFKLSDSQLKEIDFYLSNSVAMTGGFFNKGAVVENGILVISDTTARYSRTFDKGIKGKIVGIPQKNPGSSVVRSLSVLFEKGELSYTFQFDLVGDGTYVLNSQGQVALDGVNYKINTYNPATNTGEKCKLLFALRRQSVVIDEAK